MKIIKHQNGWTGVEAANEFIHEMRRITGCTYNKAERETLERLWNQMQFHGITIQDNVPFRE